MVLSTIQSHLPNVNVLLSNITFYDVTVNICINCSIFIYVCCYITAEIIFILFLLVENLRFRCIFIHRPINTVFIMLGFCMVRLS